MVATFMNRRNKDEHFQNYLRPDFSDERAAKGAAIRSRLQDPDLTAYEKDRLELDEKEQALSYWGF